MTLLITGGAGFVLSHLTRHWLESDPAARVVVLDLELDEAAERFFAPARDRLTFVRGDVRDPAVWESLAAHPITHIVHGATITAFGELERQRAHALTTINFAGTLNALEFARRLPALRRFIYVSSGSVYGEPTPETSAVPVSETARCFPVDLYAITKQSAEALARRYGELFGLEVASVRFSSVYGPMDRATPGRSVELAPKRIVTRALAGRPLKIRSLEAGGDWIHAGDVARALAALLRAERLRHPVYNVALGQWATLGELIEIVREAVPDLRVEVVPPAEAEIVNDPRNRLAQWAAYDISRLRDELGWQPRPLREALLSYVEWLRENAVTSDG